MKKNTGDLMYIESLHTRKMNRCCASSVGPGATQPVRTARVEGPEAGKSLKCVTATAG